MVAHTYAVFVSGFVPDSITQILLFILSHVHHLSRLSVPSRTNCFTYKVYESLGLNQTSDPSVESREKVELRMFEKANTGKSDRW